MTTAAPLISQVEAWTERAVTADTLDQAYPQTLA